MRLEEVPKLEASGWETILEFRKSKLT